MTTSFFLATLLLTSSPFGVRSQCNDDYAVCSKRVVFPVTSDLDSFYKDKETELRGSELKAALNGLISGHKYYSYNCAWTALGELDKDPVAEDSVRGIYTQKPIARLNRDKCTLADGSGKNYDTDAWNREHLWSKSHGFPHYKQHAYTDLHHLVAADNAVNSDRSANDFKNGGTLKICKSKNDTCCEECREDSTLRSWEPPDTVKGQIARIMMYMDVRYEGNDYDTTLTPDLTLVDESTQEKVTDSENAEYQGIYPGLRNLTYHPEFGYLSDLLIWHCQDPVSDFERARNDGVESWQGNRNPFVDRPGFAEGIWGDDDRFKSIFADCPTIGGTGPVAAPTASPTVSVWINEFHYDNSGRDFDKFIEIGCNQKVDLVGYKIRLFNGASGSQYRSITIGNKVCAPNNDFVVVQVSNFQNGPDGIALYNPKDDPIDYLAYEASFRTNTGLFMESISSAESESTSRGFSLQKIGEGCQGNDFVWKKTASISSRGRVNDGQVLKCGVEPSIWINEL